MKKLGVALAAGMAVIFVSTSAMAGSLQFVATSAKGKRVKAGKYGTWTRVYRNTDLKRLKASTRRSYSVKANYCGKDLMLRKTQARWIAAHKKLRHKIVLRERLANRKYKVLCNL